MHENGTITHDEAILEENSKNNKSVIETMNQILNKKE
ncbi:hypothetical protein KA405_06420 [Patescibacteria group bacterium]|nr:hypothetical protein [Patescibacteria group bacterium]